MRRLSLLNSSKVASCWSFGRRQAICARRPSGQREAGAGGRYWVRLGNETVDAVQRGGSILRGLIDQTARVPWDDRPARTARVEDMREAKAREFLHDVRSGLLDEPDACEIYRRLRLVARINVLQPG